MLTGYDLSSNNSESQFASALNLDFVIIKSSEGKSYTNPVHDAWVTRVRAAGRLVGHYHYAHPENNSAATEAAQFLATAKPQAGDVLVLDFEPPGIQDTYVDWIIAFADAVFAKVGVLPWLYTNNSQGTALSSLATRLQRPRLFALPLWKAYYQSSFGSAMGWNEVTCWQRTDSPIDTNVFYGDAARWRSLGVGGSTPPPPPPPPVTRELWYPKADNSVQNWQGTLNRPALVDPRLLVWHTTETQGWPGYSNGSVAPNITFNLKTLEWRGHFPLNYAAMALVDPDTTPVKENREGPQIELVGTCNDALRDDPNWVHVDEISEEAWRELGQFAAFLFKYLGIPLKSTVTWTRYDSNDPATGQDNGIRLTSDQLAAYEGHLGHQHVSGNNHRDPGKFNITKLLAYALASLNGTGTGTGTVIEVTDLHIDSNPPADGAGYSPITSAFVTEDGKLWVTRVAPVIVVPPPPPPPPPVDPPPPPPGDTVPALPPESAFNPGQRHDSFTWMGQQFVRILGSKIRNDGNGYQPGPVYSTYDEENVKLVQQYGLHENPDGWFGPTGWSKLATMGDISGSIPDNAPPPPPPPPSIPPLPPQSAFQPGQRHDSFTWMGDQFKRILGSKIKSSADGYQSGPVFSTYDVENVKLVQQYGYDNTADGWFGPTQWAGLPGLGDISGKIPSAPPPPPPPPPVNPPPAGISTPYPNAVATTPFGVKGSWAAGFHTGRDYACNVGTPLRSTWTSKVVSINSWGSAYGIHVIMEHSSGGVVHRIAYCHMSRIDVPVGASLVPGSHVGLSGNTGNTTGPHVHVEDRTSPFGYNNKVVNPIL